MAATEIVELTSELACAVDVACPVAMSAELESELNQLVYIVVPLDLEVYVL